MATLVQLDETADWFARNPFVAQRREERRAWLKHVQAAADEFSDGDYQRYAGLWSRHPAEAAEMARAGILYFLEKRTAHALQEIRATRVTRGLVAWHIYNMGYVFKTPEACFAIDVHARGTEAFADEIDFLLITHSHGDHVTPKLLEAMQARGKPVVSNWWDGGRRVAGPETLAFGPVRVAITLGDHAYHDPARTNDMLLYEIDAGEASGRASIYHVGDNSNLNKMNPTRPIGLYIFHVAVGLPVVDSIRKVDAKLALASHVLELGHSRFPPHAWRWSYDYAYDQIAPIDPSRADVPVWGERYECLDSAWKQS